MMYGNILPSITVEARTMEDAKRAVMPVIEELYQTYCTAGADGKLPKFVDRSSVTAVEKIVPQTPPPAMAVAQGPIVVHHTQAVNKAPEAPKTALDALVDDLRESVAYTKAKNAVNNCTTLDALNMIESQIQNSVKLTTDEKPLLLSEILKKRKEL